MNLQELLIDGIEFLSTLPDQEDRLTQWQEHLNEVNRSGTTPPNCPKGYYWNGSQCVLDVG